MVLKMIFYLFPCFCNLPGHNVHNQCKHSLPRHIKSGEFDFFRSPVVKKNLTRFRDNGSIEFSVKFLFFSLFFD